MTPLPKARDAPSLTIYRQGYPGLKDYTRYDENYQFYSNIKPSAVCSDWIDNLHTTLFGDFDRIDNTIGLVHWLFPIREDPASAIGAHRLHLQEARLIQNSDHCMARLELSWRLWLDFLGLDLVDATTGEVARKPGGYMQRYRNLSDSVKNQKRTTHVLKSLGELGREQWKGPFVEFLLHECFQNQLIVGAREA